MWRATLIVLALGGALAAAASSLVSPSPYAPLLVGGMVAALAVLAAWLRKPAWALYAALFVVFLPIGLIPEQAQSTLNRTLTMAALAVWLLNVVSRRRRVALTGPTMLIMGFLVWSGVTLLWANNLETAATSLQVYALRLLLFLLLLPSEIEGREQVKGLMNTLALSGWALVLAGAYVALRGGYTAGAQFQVLNQNENDTGVLALVALTGVLWQVLRPDGGNRLLHKLLTVSYLVLAMALTAVSGSRGSAVSFVVTLLAMCLWKRTRAWGVLGLLILALGAIIAPFVLSTTLERFLTSEGGTLLGGREALWQAAWMVIRDHPLQGVGIGNGPSAVMSYVRSLRSVGNRDLVSIHNPLLTIWAETGIPGLALYVGALGTAIAGFLWRWRHAAQADAGLLRAYLALVLAVFGGYMCSWIKGGGTESAFSYFLMLALLLIPSYLPEGEWEPTAVADALPRPEDRSSNEAYEL